MSATTADIIRSTRAQTRDVPRRHGLASACRQVCTWLFVFLVVVLLLCGWRLRDLGYINAEEGLGYWLGIAGGTGMLLQLGYTLRKKVAWMRCLGKVRYWFIVHMMMGILAPVMILFHANFSLGSLNSNVALASMLIVVASGIIGRFIYGRIHKGLTGRQLSLQGLRSELEEDRHVMQPLFAFDPGLGEQLDGWRERVSRGRPPLLQLVFLVFLPWRLLLFRFDLGRRTRRALVLLGRERGWTQADIRRHRRQVGRSLKRYVQDLHSVAGFAFYTRLFALWHVLHLPLFVLLLVSAVFHVIAVHMY